MTAYADDGSLHGHIEAVKRAWWNVVVDNSWEYVGGPEDAGNPEDAVGPEDTGGNPVDK